MNELDPKDYIVEYCPFCDSEVVIRAKDIMPCPSCGKPLAPCSVCWSENGSCHMSGAVPNTCPYGYTGISEDEYKEPTAPPMTPEEIEFAWKNC